MNLFGMNELDAVEILTLQDNYIDMTPVGNSEMIRRAGSREKGEIRKSILSEHGSPSRREDGSRRDTVAHCGLLPCAGFPLWRDEPQTHWKGCEGWTNGCRDASAAPLKRQDASARTWMGRPRPSAQRPISRG